MSRSLTVQVPTALNLKWPIAWQMEFTRSALKHAPLEVAIAIPIGIAIAWMKQCTTVEPLAKL